MTDAQPTAELQPASEVESVAAADPRAGHLAGALAALIVGAALTLTADVSALALLVATAAVQAVLVLTWVRATGLPGRIGALVVAGAAAAAADVLVSVYPHSHLGIVLAVLGLAVPALFVHQLLRGVVRTRVVESLSDIALVVVAVVALASYLQLRHEFNGDAPAGVVVSAVIGASALALIVGYLVDVVAPVARFDVDVPRGLPGLVLGAGAALAVCYLRLASYFDFGPARALFIGAAIGAVAGLLAVGMAFVARSSALPADGLSRRLRPVFAACIPLCVTAPVAYLLVLAVRA